MTANSEVKVGGILLAAGGSSRFGSPKQLFEFEGKTLLRRAAESLANSKCVSVIVVLGAEIERSRLEIGDLPFVVNEKWESGMSSSIRLGLEALLKTSSKIDAVLIVLCDQPRVTSEKMDLFMDEFARNRSPIIAAEYDGVRGVPALFSRELFDDLVKLDGDKGARELIRKSRCVAGISGPEASFDIDVVPE